MEIRAPRQKGSHLSLSDFLNRKLHRSSVLPTSVQVIFKCGRLCVNMLLYRFNSWGSTWAVVICFVEIDRGKDIKSLIRLFNIKCLFFMNIILKMEEQCQCISLLLNFCGVPWIPKNEDLYGKKRAALGSPEARFFLVLVYRFDNFWRVSSSFAWRYFVACSIIILFASKGCRVMITLSSTLGYSYLGRPKTLKILLWVN